MTASAMILPSAPAERAPRRTPRDAARCIVGEYLRDWGLRDPDVIAARSREIVDQAERFLDVAPESALTLSEAALGIAVDLITAAVVVKPEAGETGSLVPQASVVAEVSHILEEYPCLAHGSPGDLDQEAAGVLATAAAPIVPQAKRSEMPAQPGTRVWRLVSPAYYQGLVKRLALAFREPVQGSETVA
jgi:hypothetical protein